MTRVTVVGAILVVALFLIALFAIQALNKANSFDQKKSELCGGDRNCIPNFQVLQQQRRGAAALFQLEPNGAEHRRLS